MNKNQIHSSIIKVGNMISKFLKKLFTRHNNIDKNNEISTSQYSKESIHTYKTSAYATQSTQALFQIICEDEQPSSNTLPTSIQQYLNILKHLQNCYTLSDSFNSTKSTTRNVQLLYVLYHQHMISYIKPTAPINNQRIENTYKYLTQTVQNNRYCSSPKKFYKQLFQTINYNRNHYY